MPTPRFLQIHTLHSYPAVLLNRDDTGLAKRMPFGDAIRTRISSQCLKRHWRIAKDEFAIRSIPGAADAVRSRSIIGRAVMEPLRNGDKFTSEGVQITDEVLAAVETEFNIGVYGSSVPTGNGGQRGPQPLLLGRPEVEYLQQKAAAICAEYPTDAKTAGDVAKLLFVDQRRNEERNNFRAFREVTTLPGGLEGALFGRMITSDTGANIDASVHVAHAFTVHPEENGIDYFTVVDDLLPDDEDPGADFIGDMELTAGLFYGYVVVDVPGLISNLEGCPADDWQNADRELAAKVVEHLTHLIATVSPGAKLGSTAPYACADLMLIEAGSRQPRSLANAYRQPARARIEDATAKLSEYLGKIDAAYGAKESRRVMSVEDCDLPGAGRLNLDDLADWAAAAIRSGEAE